MQPVNIDWYSSRRSLNLNFNIASLLRPKLVSAYKNVWDMKEKMGVDIWDAALGVVVSRVASAIQQLGLFP